MKNEGITSKNGYAIPKLSYIAGDSSLGDSISFLSRVRLHECFPKKTLIGRKMIQNGKMGGLFQYHVLTRETKAFYLFSKFLGLPDKFISFIGTHNNIQGCIYFFRKKYG